MLRVLKKILLWTSVVLVVLVIASLIIVRVYEDEVKAYAVQRLNNYLDAPVDVEHIDLTLFAKFPSASLDFENVLIQDAWQDSTRATDTLLFAKHMYMQFDLLDLFGDSYTVRNVTLEEGKLNLRVDEDGADNYHFWKAPEDSTKGNFHFALEDVHLDETRVSYTNAATRQEYCFASEGIALSGDFESNIFDLAGQANCTIERFRANGVDYVSDTPAEMDVHLRIDTKAGTYSVENGKLSLADLAFIIDGEVSRDEDGHNCGVTISGDAIDLEQLWTILPSVYRRKLDGYDSRGALDLTASISGLMNATTNPTLDATFHIEQGVVTEKSSQITLRGLDVSGRYHSENDPNKETLVIEQLSGRLGSGELRADLKVYDLANPTLDLQTSGWLDLAEVHDFLKLASVQELKGTLRLNTSFTGKASALRSFDATSFRQSKASGTFTVENGRLHLTGEAHALEQLNGEFTLKGNDAAIKDLSGVIAGSDFALNGVFRNFLSWVFLPEESLTMEADLYSKHLDLDRLLVEKAAEEGGTPYALQFPARVRCNLSTSIDNLSFRNFSAQTVHGVFQLDNGILSAPQVSLQAVGGRISGSGEIDGQHPGVFLASCDMKMENIDMQKAFREFDQFGQTFLMDHHLHGNATIDLDLALAFDPQLNIDRSKIISTADLTITNGELIGFETMRAITDYMRNNRMMASAIDVDELDDKLQHIRFSKMTNRIEVRDQTVFIPRMDIASSALDISIAGEHHFDNRIDYKFTFRMAELLKRKNLESEFGPIEDDGLGLKVFLGMRGTVDDFEFYFDRESLKEQRREDWVEEKQEIKEILREEFGFFKRDTTLGDGNAGEPQTPAPEFIIEWDEFEDSVEDERRPVMPEKEPSGLRPVETPDSSRKEKDNNSRLKRFLEKLDQNDEEGEVVFELDDDGL